ncbi:MAG: acetoacetate--CoA ligase [Anaerolinea sp.]|nr:acetoacetate--CoA ligase [Anaerolinea sp.]
MRRYDVTPITEGSLLWAPTPAVKANANLTQYMNWLAQTRGLQFSDYPTLWRWSVTRIEDFWQSVWDYFDVRASQPPTAVLDERIMPGARWFSGAKLNYAENFFARQWADRPAIYYQAEDAPLQTLSWAEIERQTAVLAQTLRDLGVQPGDRVVAYMPHIPETVIALFAVASLGAVWSSCSPDFGSRSVLDRFQQIEPKALLAVDGYRYGGKAFDRRETVAELQDGLPTLAQTILFPLLAAERDRGRMTNTVVWDDLLTGTAVTPPLTFAQLPFDHPLWVLYSSGTTGKPKPIVQGHGGILLEHLKMAALHLDLKPDDRFFWYTSTGWMMWNFLVGGLLAGASIVIYNGSPGYPDMNALWRLAAQSGVTYFGTSAAFVSACMKAGICPHQDFDLRAIRAVGATGSPLTVDGFAWIYDNVNRELALESVSGGTDLCTAFVGGCRLLPIYAGEIQGACLGAKVEAFDLDGRAVIDEVGELVITAPMPSMPLYFWNDADHARYRDSYFDMYPGVWRHGDWVKVNERGGCVIYGRSDSTINRQGIRMGTSEIYQAVEALDDVLDSLIVDLELLGRESYMPLFVVLRAGVTLDDDLKQRIRQKIRADISPRHVPDDIFAIDQIPYTLSGKKMEVPVRRILLGQDVGKVANPGAMRNPGAIDYFVEMAGWL